MGQRIKPCFFMQLKHEGFRTFPADGIDDRVFAPAVTWSRWGDVFVA